MVTRFRARAAGGKICEVVCWQPEINTSTLQGRDSIPGMPQYRLEDGRPLKAIDANTFEIVPSGERITRIE